MSMGNFLPWPGATDDRLATSRHKGLMSAVHFGIVDSNTRNATANSLAHRDANGIALFNTEGWTAATLLNSFANFGTPYADAGYKVDIMGFVHLRGVVERGAGAPAAGTVIFTLGAGYAPAADVLFGVRTDTGQGELVVDTGGDVRWYAGGVTYLALDGLTFEVG